MGLDLYKLPITPFLHTAHTWSQVAAYFDAIDKWGVTLFVEIGVDKGGLAAFMWARQTFHPEFNYLGVELHTHVVDPRLNACVLYGDAFSDHIIDVVRSAVNKSSGPCLLLCDNGNKPRELATYAPIIRSGDIVAVHDYGVEIHQKDLGPVLSWEFVGYLEADLPMWKKP